MPRKLHKEARTQEHYNNILNNDKNQLIEKISDESKKKKKAEEILEEIKKEILLASVEYENCMSIMKQKQLISARCKTDKVALEKELTKTKADLENIMLRINEENKTKGIYLDKIAVLHLECEQLKAKYTLKQANLLRIQQENTEIQRKIVEEKSGFETIKNFELTQKLLHTRGESWLKIVLTYCDWKSKGTQNCSMRKDSNKAKIRSRCRMRGRKIEASQEIHHGKNIEILREQLVLMRLKACKAKQALKEKRKLSLSLQKYCSLFVQLNFRVNLTTSVFFFLLASFSSLKISLSINSGLPASPSSSFFFFTI